MLKTFFLSFASFFIYSCVDISDPSFSRDVQPVFSSNCAFSGCHAASVSASANLDLSTGSAYESIVDVPSTQIPSIFRVVPEDADNSYLYQKITGASGIDGEVMPRTGSLNQTEKDIITNWINQGAKDN
jgi:hypothetical protein